LLERRRRGASLTSDGQLLVDLAADLVRGLEQLDAAFESHRGALSGRVVLAASTAMMLYLLPEALARFRRAYPQIRVETRPTTTLAMAKQVLDDEVDFALGDPGESAAPGTRIEVVRTCERLLVAARGDPILRLPGPLHAEQLRDRDWVVLPEFTLTRRKLDVVLGRYPIAMEVETWEVMKTYVALGLGIAMMPDICVLPGDQRRLGTAALGKEFGRSHFSIMSRKNKRLSPAALALIETISPPVAGRLTPSAGR
jgi:DNA-binding transcriptional LysR family regulator